MQNLKNGDIDALKGIYTIMNKSVYLLAYSILGSEKAKDILQETFIKVAQNIKSYKANNASAWICKIARNLSYTEYTKSKRTVSIEVFEENLFDKNNNENLWIENILLRDAILTLDILEREAVILFALDKYKHREIAKILDKPVGTVKWLYSRAIKKLKKYMEEKNNDN
ncbi:MAG: RNA polymerase sigma factor [Firmicutes bacterium]|nr:RNA polymerase sigma factor [Bacillota bacterium]